METHTTSDLTHALLNLIPDRPLTTLGNKQISVLKQLNKISHECPSTSDNTDEWNSLTEEASHATSKGRYPRINSRSGPCATSKGESTKATYTSKQDEHQDNYG